MKILIADDDTGSRLILKKALETLGHEALEASDGLAAWKLFNQDPARIVISDWMMPGLDGLEFCRKIRDRPKADYVYFVLLTSQTTSRENYVKVMEHGVDDYMTKPLNRQAIEFRLKVAARIVGLTALVKTLEGIIPICSHCKNIRRDNQVYEAMEKYIQEHSSAVFSHGICPDCVDKVKDPGFGSRSSR